MYNVQPLIFLGSILRFHDFPSLINNQNVLSVQTSSTEHISMPPNGISSLSPPRNWQFTKTKVRRKFTQRLLVRWISVAGNLRKMKRNAFSTKKLWPNHINNNQKSSSVCHFGFWKRKRWILTRNAISSLNSYLSQISFHWFYKYFSGKHVSSWAISCPCWRNAKINAKTQMFEGKNILRCKHTYFGN